MKNNNLLASVALFSELYNSDTYQSIPDILAEFIKGAVVFEKRFSLNSTELKELLQKTYGFTIPESVLRTTLKNRLKDIVTKEFDNFHFEASLLSDYQGFKSNVESIDDKQNDILSELYKYTEAKKEIELSQVEKDKVFENFSHFLMDNGYSDKYSDIISSFVISKETEVAFKEELSAIKEGLILYQGINYSNDINQLGSWKDKLTIYLSTEHLFNCLGYNGVLFKEIFDDFSSLVNEINRGHSKEAGNKLIELKFLDETNEEIDHFFKSAESIKKGYKRLDPSKLAMSNILKGCEDVSDIKEKQINFFLELKRKGITHQEYSFDIEKSEFNVVDETVIERLRKTSEEKKMRFNEEYCTICLRLFTKINTFRRGKNNVPFEKIGHIYITENGFAKYLGHNNTVKFEERDIAFAKDIDYVISKFWFKLKKGFNDKASLPKTFDLVTKAKIIMSSHLNNSLSNNYDKLQDKYKKGEITEEVAIELSHAYKVKPNSPEMISSSNIDDSLHFLDDENFIEDFLREKTRKEAEFTDTLKEKEALEQELQKYKQKELEAERKALQEKEEKKLYEKREKHQIELETYNRSLNSFIQEQWSNEYKTRKWHLWNYLVFVAFAILSIFLLISLRNYIFTSFEIEITETSKLYYSGIVAVIGFIATTIRSFFNSKNILFALKLTGSKTYRKKYKEESLIAFNKNYKLENKEPILQ
jgi:hypothetical protein